MSCDPPDRLKRRPLPLHQALRIAIEVPRALETAHRHGIVHRDLKPGNIMVTEAGAKLLDFGLAKVHNQRAAEGQTMTLTRQAAIVGTIP